MITDQSLEERLQLVHEIVLAAAHNHRIYRASSPKASLYEIIQTILLNDEPCSASPQETATQVLKRSPVWKKILPYLDHSDNRCATKSCGHYPNQHGPEGRCLGRHWNYSVVPSTNTLCTCTVYVKKKLK